MLSDNQIHHAAEAYSAFSALAAFCSGLVVITGFLFPKQIMSPSKPFSHTIFFISLCDCFGSIGGSLGLPAAGTPQCTAQGFLLLYFYPASWIWTTLLVYQIRCLLVYKRLWLRPLHMHLICWTIVTLTAFLPFTTNNRFGQDDELSAAIPCNLNGNPVTAFNWSLVSFGCVLLVGVVFMTIFSLHIVYHWTLGGTQIKNKSKEFSIYRTTRLYPVVMLVCWLPYLGIAVFDPYSQFDFSIGFALVLILSSQYGTFLTVIFFLYCRVARQQWRRILGLTPEGEDKDTSTVETPPVQNAPANPQPESTTKISSITSVVVPRNSNLAVDDTSFGVNVDYDDERLLYICAIDDEQIDNMTMSGIFRQNSDFNSKQFDPSEWSGNADSNL